MKGNYYSDIGILGRHYFSVKKYSNPTTISEGKCGEVLGSGERRYRGVIIED